jgi:predicted nuclease with TOPRIM domain
MSTTESIRSEGKQYGEAKDMLIAQLKREIKDLSESQERYNELRSKYDQLQHMNDLLNDEKRRMEGDFQDKNQKNNKTIASLRSENEGLTLKTSELEYQVTNLQKQNDWFEEVGSI